jgi:hypothetical protein
LNIQIQKQVKLTCCCMHRFSSPFGSMLPCNSQNFLGFKLLYFAWLLLNFDSFKCNLLNLGLERSKPIKLHLGSEFFTMTGNVTVLMSTMPPCLYYCYPWLAFDIVDTWNTLKIMVNWVWMSWKQMFLAKFVIQNLWAETWLWLLYTLIHSEFWAL